MITANKGEWSELYALFKLLCDGELSAGDENLNKLNNLIYPVVEFYVKNIIIYSLMYRINQRV